MNELIELFQKLQGLGAQVNDEWKIGMVFASLPRRYSNLVKALEERNTEDLTWSLVYSKILDENFRQEENEEPDHREKLMN